jgi:hypothetical protein
MTGSGGPTSTKSISSSQSGLLKTNEVSEGFAEREESKTDSNDSYWALVAVSIMMIFCVCAFIALMVMEVGLANRSGNGNDEWED